MTLKSWVEQILKPTLCNKLRVSNISVIITILLTPLIFEGSSIYGWQFAAVGDIECNNTGNDVADGMMATDSEINILLGDVGYGEEQCIFDYFKGSGVKILAACGNHDDCGELEKLSGHPSTFGFVRENVAFQIVNTETSLSSQEKEIENNFKEWQADPNINSIVIAQHQVTITNPSAHHPESETEGFRDFYVDLKDKYPKFTLLLQGHNHGYQICEPDSPDIIVVTDGTGGRESYSWGSSMDENCDISLSGSKYNGFSLFGVTGGEISGRHYSIESQEYSEGF
jgi:hypothetical protein